MAGTSVRFKLQKATTGGKNWIVMFFNYGYGERNPVTEKVKYTPLKYATGEHIEDKLWNSKEERAFPKTYELKDINSKLNRIEQAVKDVYRSFEMASTMPTPQQIRESLDLKLNKTTEKPTNIGIVDFIKSEIEMAKKLPTKPKEGTVKQYNNFVNKLIEYEQHFGKLLTFKNLTEQAYLSFFEFFEKENYAQNTIWKFRKNWKKFLDAAIKAGLTISFDYKDKKYNIKDEEVEDVYLTVDELKLLTALDLQHNKSLDIVRDIFVASNYTGLRFSDTKRVVTLKNAISAKTGNPYQFIELRTVKTGEVVKIPALPQVVNVYEKYGNQFPKTYSDQYFNRAIKKVCELAGLNESIEYRRLRNGKETTEFYPKFELISSHTGRRSFASNFYNKIPVHTIMKITGHRTERAFLRYIKLSQKEHMDIMIDSLADEINAIF